MKLFLFATILLFSINIDAQIYEPEGLNLPGLWNDWTNPPTNNLALASYTQVAGGRVIKISTGTPRWQTIFSVAASGGDVIGGTYPWLFTSGPSGNPYQNKWAGVNVVMNSIQDYSYNTGADNNITVSNGKWYTINWKDNGYSGTSAIIMETSGQPVTLTNVTSAFNATSVPVNVNISLSHAKSAEELIFVRYTTDNWATSSFVTASGSGTSYLAVIPGSAVTGTVENQFYVFTTTFANPTHDNADLVTINFINNNGNNYPLPVELISFNAVVNGSEVQLNWETATELNNHGFEVQRSINFSDFESIAFINGAGSTTDRKNYSFSVNENYSGLIQYRLKQIDYDGSFSYSQIVEVDLTLPEKFILYQNYPNPFNPVTTIRFELPEGGLTELKVFDITGNEIAELIKEIKNAGTYSVSYDASKLSSGVYFYTLKINNRTFTNRMILIK